jgi:acetyl-CoA C-acetyltransferase
VESQKRAARAWAEGRFPSRSSPVRDQLGLPILSHDETVRGDASMQSLASLNPSFRAWATWPSTPSSPSAIRRSRRSTTSTTPAIRSGIVDGAAGVLFGTKEMGEALGLKARARHQGHGLDRFGARRSC